MKISIGDIIEHEKNYAVICRINNDEKTAYILPIVNEITESERLVMRFEPGSDIVYCKKRIGSGWVLIEEGKEVSLKRIEKTIGFVHPKFLSKVIRTLGSSLEWERFKEIRRYLI